MTPRPGSSALSERLGQRGSRRLFLLGTLAACAGCHGGARPPAREPETDSVASPGIPSERASPALAALERSIGGRLGVYALDTGTRKHVLNRPDERFALCSTFKWALAAHILEQVERGELRLEDELTFGQEDLLDYAPATRARALEGKMSIEELARAAIVVSDNTAANLLLARVGGPPAFTEFMRRNGDTVTRLDRDEPSLNDNQPGDPRDTTSPRAMTELLERLACHAGLSAASRSRLLDWLASCETGAHRLQAGLPAGYRLGHKTGTGQRGAVNDVGIVWPPAGAPILISAYLSDSTRELSALEGALAEVARIVVRELS